MPKVMVLGLGNLLMGDDGIGVHIANELRKHPLPEGVEVIDAGTGGISCLSIIEDADILILIDAVDIGTAPGEMVELPAEEVMKSERASPISLHEFGVADMLAFAEMVRTRPMRTMFIGIQIASLKPADEPSHVLKERMDAYVDAVKRKVQEAISSLTKEG